MWRFASGAVSESICIGLIFFKATSDIRYLQQRLWVPTATNRNKYVTEFTDIFLLDLFSRVFRTMIPLRSLTKCFIMFCSHRGAVDFDLGNTSKVRWHYILNKCIASYCVAFRSELTLYLYVKCNHSSRSVEYYKGESVITYMLFINTRVI